MTNFFNYKLSDFYNYYLEKRSNCICVQEIEDINTLKAFGVALLDENLKLIDIEEKPENPKSNVGVYATYIYTRDSVQLFEQYVNDGNKVDAPGYFTEWLYKRSDVFAYFFKGDCIDIGTPKTYSEVCEKFNC